MRARQVRSVLGGVTMDSEYSIRFRKVASKYPRVVTEAYGGDIAQAARDTDEQVAVKVREWEVRQGLEGVWKLTRSEPIEASLETNPNTGPLPCPKIPVDRAPDRKISRQLPPGAQQIDIASRMARKLIRRRRPSRLISATTAQHPAIVRCISDSAHPLPPFNGKQGTRNP
jgi:hypothetical protein